MNATRLSSILDAGVFGCLLVVWTLGYVALCPPTGNHRHVDFQVAQR